MGRVVNKQTPIQHGARPAARLAFPAEPSARTTRCSGEQDTHREERHSPGKDREDGTSIPIQRRSGDRPHRTVACRQAFLRSPLPAPHPRPRDGTQPSIDNPSPRHTRLHHERQHPIITTASTRFHGRDEPPQATDRAHPRQRGREEAEHADKHKGRGRQRRQQPRDAPLHRPTTGQTTPARPW